MRYKTTYYIHSNLNGSVEMPLHNVTDKVTPKR